MNEQPKIGCVNHDCDKCKAVQEPVAIVDEDGVIVVCNYKYKPGDKLYTTPPAPQPVPVKTYHDGKPWPVQPVPHECQTEAEKTAYAFGWWKAMEYVREHGVIK